GVRIGGQSFAADLLAETLELRLAQPPLDEGPGVDAGRAVTLAIDELAAVILGWGMPEMIESRVVERGGRLEARYVSTQLRGRLVGPQDHRERVPAHEVTNPSLDIAIARVRRLGLERDGVDVTCVRMERQPRSLATCRGHHGVEDLVHPLQALDGRDRIERFEPFRELVVPGWARSGIREVLERHIHVLLSTGGELGGATSRSSSGSWAHGTSIKASRFDG